MARPSRCLLELRRRAVRMVVEVCDDYPNCEYGVVPLRPVA